MDGDGSDELVDPPSRTRRGRKHNWAGNTWVIPPRDVFFYYRSAAVLLPNHDTELCTRIIVAFRRPAGLPAPGQEVCRLLVVP